MTGINSGTVIFLKKICERYPGALFALVIREGTGDIRVEGDPTDIFVYLIHLLKKWQADDPECYDTIRGVFQAAFDFVGRDLDLEALNHETKNSAA